MEVDDIQSQQQPFKFPRIRRLGEEEEEVTDGGNNANNKILHQASQWPSSRIVRVSRTSGGKDRHSKVLTSRGPRDRRIRLSVTTAIQFYDLQDRLGYDQPSKAVEWLLQAASTSIDELPCINSPFPETPKQISDGKRSSPEEEEVERDDGGGGGELVFQQQQQQRVSSISRSTCSSNSETSKGSGLSLSRCETRVKARERARGRAAEKDKEKEHRSIVSQNSFTQLLASGMNNNNSGQDSNLLKKSSRQWSTAPMDCFSTGFSGSSSSSAACFNNNTLPFSMSVTPFNVDHHHHHHGPPPEQHFSLLPDSTGGGDGEYNLNFSISPASFSGYSRGTLQSNSQSLSTLPHHHLQQRFSHIEGSNSNLPLFIGTASSTPDENNHHQFPAALEGRRRLHLGYGDRFLHSDLNKGKEKN